MRPARVYSATGEPGDVAGTRQPSWATVLSSGRVPPSSEPSPTPSSTDSDPDLANQPPSFLLFLSLLFYGEG